MLDQAVNQNHSISRLVENGLSFPTVSEACDLNTLIELMGVETAIRSNAEIYGEAEPASHLYKLIDGSVRTYKILNDGRRQITAFYLPGDIFGLELGDKYTVSAEAIHDCKVLRIKRSVVVSLAVTNNTITRDLWNATAVELHRAQSHVALLIKSALERVADFLLEMNERSVSDCELDLSMSRQDIADYLGLRIESVSRSLSQLQATETIKVEKSRHVVLRNRAALKRMNA